LIYVQDAAKSAVDRPYRIDQVFGPTLALIGVLAFLVGPRGAPVELVMLSAAPLLAMVGRGWFRAVVRPLPVLVVALLMAAYLVVNASWAVDRVEAYNKVAYCLVLIAIVHPAIVGMPYLSDRTLRDMQRAALIATCIGVTFLAFETLTEDAIKRVFFSLVPAARPDPKHVKVVDGWVTYVAPYLANRNMAALCLVIWPALLMLPTFFRKRGAAMVGTALLAVCAVAILDSDHETSMLALAFSGLTLLGMWLSAPIVRKLVLAGWIIATTLIVPLATMAYQEQLYRADWLPTTGRNRIILWSYTAQQIKKAPLFGVGVASTKELDRASADAAQQPADHSYPLRTGRHSHNVFMQTWYELGGIGAVLLLALGVAAIRDFASLPARRQAIAFASFASAVVIAGFSWGIWQTWFLASYGIWAVVLALALEGARRRSKSPAPAT
jgi:O-antigen ligase